MTPPLLVISVVFNLGVAVGLGAAAQFLWRARQMAPPSLSLDARPSAGTLREFAHKVELRGRLNARAGTCVAVAAACQAVSITTFLMSRGQL